MGIFLVVVLDPSGSVLWFRVFVDYLGVGWIVLKFEMWVYRVFGYGCVGIFLVEFWIILHRYFAVLPSRIILKFEMYLGCMVIDDSHFWQSCSGSFWISREVLLSFMFFGTLECAVVWSGDDIWMLSGMLSPHPHWTPLWKGRPCIRVLCPRIVADVSLGYAAKELWDCSTYLMS